MSWTKERLIQKAFGLIGLASYTYDIEADEFEDALLDLDSMMSEWSSEGFLLGWPLTTTITAASLKMETDIQSDAVTAITYNLACRLAPQFGKPLQQVTMNTAANSKRMLKGRITEPAKIRAQQTVAGQGNRSQYGDSYDNFTVGTQDNRVTRPENEEVDFRRG